MASTFHVEHFGCRAARADGEAVSERLRAAGLSNASPPAADVVIVNACSVTAEADRAARAFIRRAHRLNPEARIVVTGCYAQRAPEELAGMDGVAAVVGNSHKALAPEIILGLSGNWEVGALKGHGFSRAAEALHADAALQAAEKFVEADPNGRIVSGHDFSRAVNAAKSTRPLGPEGRISPILPASRSFSAAYLAAEGKLVSVESLLSSGARAPIWADDRFAHSFLEEAQMAPGAQTRPNLKIQEGCGNRCTFCVIPQTRGPSKSLPAASVLRQVEGFVAAGGKELVLSGINLGRWGRDFPSSEATASRTLPGLVRAIFERTALPRLRLSSIEPMDWDAELIGLMAEFGNPKTGAARLARHAHLPLQSGSDAVLRRMHRRYRPWHYVEKVDALVRACGPALTLGADVMVGFPGETGAEFEETLALVRLLPFGYLHLFPFSPRPATMAWALHAERPVAAEAVAERMKALRALAAEKCHAHRKSFVGQELEAITLHTPVELAARELTAALTGNFLPVELKGRLEANRLMRVRVTGLTAEGALKAVQGENLT
jgi:threonylcarbamoyladenosine tRNA methylthiotransferase MtaB